MNRFAAGALALALFFAGAFWAQRPAVAQQTGGDVWEYRVFRLDPGDYQDKQDYKTILAKEGPRAGDAAFKEHVLKFLGQEGWELIHIEIRQQNMIYFYLKRRPR